MKLMDKIKDLFMDEVIDDDEIELEEEEKEEYKEPPKEVLPKVMRENIAKEEKVELRVKPEEFIREEKKEEYREVKPEPKKFTFPIDFDEEVSKVEKREQIPSRNNKREFNENDFLPKRNIGNGNVNVLNLEKEASRKVSELYPKKEEVKPKFKASPVISPVYGVLDKNYTKEEVREKTDDVKTLKRPSKQVDFETVRKKAFGNLADEIKDNMLCENCELYKEVKKISALKEDDLLYDMTVDDEEKDVTIERAYDNYEEFGVAYEPKVNKKTLDVDTLEEEKEKEFTSSLNDIIKDNNATKEELKISYSRIDEKVDNNEIEEKNVVPEVIKEIESNDEDFPSRQEKKKETKVDDDFFKLIDSMYKERIDD